MECQGRKILHPNKGHVERLRETSLCANFSARRPPCGILRLKASRAGVFLECGGLAAALEGHRQVISQGQAAGAQNFLGP